MDIKLLKDYAKLIAQLGGNVQKGGGRQPDQG